MKKFGGSFVLVVIFFCWLFGLIICEEEPKVIKEHAIPQAIPLEWKSKGPADPNDLVRLTFALKQSNLDLLEKRFWAVSDPTNSEYGKFWTIEQIANLISPKAEHVKSLFFWLYDEKIRNYELTKGKDFVIVEIPVKRAEELLSIKLYEYSHVSKNMSIIRTPGPYYLPKSVADAVDFVGGVMRFPRSMKILTKRPTSLGVTPNSIKTTFGVPGNATGQSSLNSQAVAQFLQQYYNPKDLAAFQTYFKLPSQTVAREQGPNDPSNPGLEAELDIQYIMAMGVKIPTWFVSTGGEYKGQEPFLDWIVNMSNTANSPFVHSVSYGDVESSLTTDYTSRINVEFQKYGLLGRSILFASGDDGAGCDDSCKVFSPNFPASSPYVTSVGGIYSSGNSLYGDTISSGGFSNYFSRVSYQDAAVAHYVKGKMPPNSYYNASGRAMPDVCSFSEGVLIMVHGSLTPVGGTSCAAPVFSGIVALINDQRLQKGKTPLGFLNPFLYQTYAKYNDAFIDIVQGSNPNGCCGYGFEAREGYDLVTGIGAPNYPNLLKYALSI